MGGEKGLLGGGRGEKITGFYGGECEMVVLYRLRRIGGGSILVALFTVLPLFGDWIWAPFFFFLVFS